MAAMTLISKSFDIDKSMKYIACDILLKGLTIVSD
jgi:hypothetical protein